MRLLIFISLLFFASCGTVNYSDNEINNTKSDNTIANTSNSEIDNTPEVNLSTHADIEAFLNSDSDYHLSSLGGGETKESVQNYINNDDDYTMDTLINKTTSSNIEIIYGDNTSLIIPKDKIYVISNSSGTDIFVTFNANNYEIAEKFTGLVIIHDTLKIPTGFLNIQLNSVTPDSLKSDIERAFSQIAINNPKLDNNGTKITYKTDKKNYGKTIECQINESAEIFPIDSDEINIDTKENTIPCSIGKDDNKTTFVMGENEDEPTLDINTTSLNLNNNLIVNELSNTKIRIIGRINNKISHEVSIVADINNSSVPIDELNVTAILTDTNHEYGKSFYESNSVSGGEKRIFKFTDISVRIADERHFKLTYRVQNIKTKESAIIDPNLMVTVFGDYYTNDGGISQSNDDSKFDKSDVDVEMNGDIFNTTYYNNVKIKIARSGTYTMICELFYNHGLTQFHSNEETIDITNEDEHKIQFIIKNLEVRDKPYTLKLTIKDKYSNESVTIEGGTFYVQ